MACSINNKMALSSLRRCSFQSVELLKHETLGIGSYGKVCKAKCDNLVCAAKILHPTFFGTNDPGARMFVEKFEQECEFLRFVTHPNIVQCLGTFQDASGSQPLPVLLLELMDESLTHFLDRSKEPLSYFTEVTISHDVALALAFLHSNGYIHRDLSSNNILLVAGSRAKVADFGMCRLSDANAKMMTTCPGTVVYMPPEALREPPRYTDKIDTFSFGVVLVQILTCLFPNPGPPREVIDEVTERIVLETKRRENHIELVQPNHPLLQIALDCLKNSDTERATARELCSRLEGLKQSQFFIQNKDAEERVNLTFFQKEQRDLRKQLTEGSLAREREIIKQLDKTAMQRENELKQEIHDLKQQLKEQWSQQDSHQSEYFRPRLGNSESPSLKREISSFHGRSVHRVGKQHRGDRENNSKQANATPTDSRKLSDSMVHESVDDWQVPQPQKTSGRDSGVQKLYDKWNIQPPAYRAEAASTKTSRYSVTSQFIDFRSTSDDISGPSLEQLLTSRIGSPSSVSQAGNSHSTPRCGAIERATNDDDFSNVNDYLGSPSHEQPDYYNVPSQQSESDEHTYYNRQRSLPTPTRNIRWLQHSTKGYHTLDSDPATQRQEEETDNHIYAEIDDRTESSPVITDTEYANVNPTSPLPITNPLEYDYDYVDDNALQSLPVQSLQYARHDYVNTTGVRSSTEQPPKPSSHEYENKDIIAQSDHASSPSAQKRPVPKPRKLRPRTGALQKSLSTSPTTTTNALPPTASLPVGYNYHRRVTSDCGGVCSPDLSPTTIKSDHRRTNSSTSPDCNGTSSPSRDYRKTSSPTPDHIRSRSPSPHYRRSSSPSTAGRGNLLSPDDINAPTTKSGSYKYQDYRQVGSPPLTDETGKKLSQDSHERGHTLPTTTTRYQNCRRTSSPTPETAKVLLYVHPSNPPVIKTRSHSNPTDPMLSAPQIDTAAGRSMVNLSRPPPLPTAQSSSQSSLHSDPNAPPRDADFEWKCKVCGNFMPGDIRICKICRHSRDVESTEWYTY